MCGNIHTDQGAYEFALRHSSGLKILKGDYLGARSAGLKAHVGQCTYRSGRSTNSVLEFLGLENFVRQFSWSPIGKAQGPYGAIYIPFRALYELGLKFSRV